MNNICENHSAYKPCENLLVFWINAKTVHKDFGRFRQTMFCGISHIFNGVNGRSLNKYAPTGQSLSSLHFWCKSGCLFNLLSVCHPLDHICVECASIPIIIKNNTENLLLATCGWFFHLSLEKSVGSQSLRSAQSVLCSVGMIRKHICVQIWVLFSSLPFPTSTWFTVDLSTAPTETKGRVYSNAGGVTSQISMILWLPLKL